MNEYSNKATPHDARMIRINGQLVVIFISSSFRLPYHANVMKMLETTSIMIVRKPFISIRF